MKARFTIDIDLPDSPDAGMLRFAGLPIVKSWEELTEKQQKEYAKLECYEMSGDDAASQLYNADDGIIKIIP